MQIQGGTAVKCWEEVMNLAKELAVDAVDRVLAIFWPMILQSRLSTLRKLDTRAIFGLFISSLPPFPLKRTPKFGGTGFSHEKIFGWAHPIPRLP